MSSTRPRSSDAHTWSSVFLHSRREAIVIFIVWLVGLFWAVPYCYFNGFAEHVEVESFSTTWGVPTWLFWGIAVPWMIANVVTVWLCFFFIKDDELGEAHEGADIAEDVAEMHEADRPEAGEDAR